MVSFRQTCGVLFFLVGGQRAILEAALVVPGHPRRGVVR